jgi:hypothetical protein
VCYAAQTLTPSTAELGGNSPNIFFGDVMVANDAFLDKAVQGLVPYAVNKGELCTCPSRALIQESIYDEFMQCCPERIAAIRQGDPLDCETMIAAQAFTAQLETIESNVATGLNRAPDDLRASTRRHHLRTRPRRWTSPTTRCTASAPPFGLATAAAASGWTTGSRPGACGPTATTSTNARRVRRLQGIRGWAREPPDDARALQPDQVPPGQI